MKSLLLGSAATLVVVAGAQAADLPTKKGAPAAEYVKVCKIGDIAGFILPGSDTCLKISGYVNAQIEGGNVKDHYDTPYATRTDVGYGLGGVTVADRQDSIGYYVRGEVDIQAVSNTAYGPLLSYIGLRGDMGGGFDGSSNVAGVPGQQANANGFVVAGAYVQWAGITAGSHPSFYDYLAGGATWKDFFSPDHSGGGGVPLMAYTATFGGGFSATVSLEQPESAGALWYDKFTAGKFTPYSTTTSAGGAWTPGTASFLSAGNNGWRSPDIVASLDVTQSWGGAHLAGVAHQNRFYVSDTATGANPYWTYSKTDDWGYGVIGGVTFNLPMLSAGSKIAFQGAWTQGAAAYSGAGSPNWGEGDFGFNTNGNGTVFPIVDAIYDPYTNTWSQSKAWTLAAELTWQLTPNFAIDPEVSYANVSYNSVAAADDGLSQSAYAWWAGAMFDWTAAKNLDFALDLVYEESHQKAVFNYYGQTAPLEADGFNARVHVIRTF